MLIFYFEWKNRDSNPHPSVWRVYLDLDLVEYFTGTLSFEWVINVKGGIYKVTSILIVVS